MAGTPTTSPSISQIPDMLRQLVRGHDLLIRQLDEAGFEHKPRPDKWSKKEILGHLIDSAQNNLRRFIVVQYEMAPAHIVYNQDAWVSANGYDQVAREDLILLWKLLNERIAGVLERLPRHNWEILCNTGKEDEELHPISFIAADYLGHLRHHLAQILS